MNTFTKHFHFKGRCIFYKISLYIKYLKKIYHHYLPDDQVKFKTKYATLKILTWDDIPFVLDLNGNALLTNLIG